MKGMRIDHNGSLRTNQKDQEGEMTDYEEIQNLIARYAHAADSYSAEDWANLFTEDGSLTEYGETVTGRDRIRALGALALQRKGRDVATANKHMQANSAIEIRGDRASATTDLMVVCLSESGWRVRGCGVYTDEFARDVDGRWKFQSRTATWSGESGHDPLNPGLAKVFQERFRQVMEEDIVAT